MSEKAQMIFDIIGLLIVLFSSVVNDRYIHSLEKKIKETEVGKNDKVRDSKVHLWHLYGEASCAVVFFENKVYTFTGKNTGRKTI